ncbi:MAG: hypothetical protein NZ602_13555 [Thermoguttaceae bacterium]|nr:hypothetical protein [Thermoguttaceae bacterium]MDW8038169.1 hypothetical protein [Thermoguttaceae bacterium]
MAELWWILAPLGLGVATGLLFWGPRLRRVVRLHRLREIRRQFHQQRERLEMKFLCLASRSSLAPGVPWMECEFEDEVAYVRNRRTGQLCALVGILLRRRHPLAVSSASTSCRVGTALFRFARNRWDTDGRAVLNLSPSETIRFYQDALEVLDQEPVQER